MKKIYIYIQKKNQYYSVKHIFLLHKVLFAMSTIIKVVLWRKFYEENTLVPVDRRQAWVARVLFIDYSVIIINTMFDAKRPAGLDSETPSGMSVCQNM